MEIKVSNIGGGYKEFEITTNNFSMRSELLDEGEAVSVACQLIRAAEDLVPPDFDVEMKALALIREGLEA